jgi:hypothetical protein
VWGALAHHCPHLRVVPTAVMTGCGTSWANFTNAP